MAIATVQASLCQHRNKDIIVVRLAYDKALISRFRQLPGATWSHTLKSWYLPDTPEYRKRFNLMPKKDEQPVTAQPVPQAVLQSQLPDRITVRSTTLSDVATIRPCNAGILPLVREQLLLKGYSKSTQRTYLNEMATFLKLLNDVPAERLYPADIRRYLVYCYEKLHLTENTLHSRMNSLNFYYEQVLGRGKFFLTIPRPQKHLILPKVLGEEELRRLFAAAANLKHKAILFVAYSAGLRVSEVINLRLQDIDRERQQLFIYCSKGKKDRYVRLSPLVLDILEQYYKSCIQKPRNYVFEGTAAGEPYTTRSAQKIFQDAKQKAGIAKTVSFHGLRHSFATHMLEKGVDVKYIKEILGHFNIKTTERYLHVRRDVLVNLESPLDSLYKNNW